MSLRHSVFSVVFVDLYSSENLNIVSEFVGIALARCKDYELPPGLYKLLPNIVFGKYESLARSAPWTRHPATVVLKQICATLTVFIFHPGTFCSINNLLPGQRITLFS